MTRNEYSQKGPGNISTKWSHVIVANLDEFEMKCWVSCHLCTQIAKLNGNRPGYDDVRRSDVIIKWKWHIGQGEGVGEGGGCHNSQ